MKKLFLSCFSLILTISTFSQNGKVISAYNYWQSYINKEGNANLEEAAKTIDIAAADPSTSESTKTWWYRSNIYQSISIEKSLADKYPKASLEAVHSFQRMKEINDPKFKDWSDAYENMRGICNNLFNDGITAYNKKNYHDAYLFFSAIAMIQEILEFKGQKERLKLLTSSLGNAALSAEYDNDYTTAAATYKKIIILSPDSTAPYVSLISLLKKSANKFRKTGDSISAKTELESAKNIQMRDCRSSQPIVTC